MADDAFRRIDALIQVGLRLARSAPSGRTALATVARSIEPEWIPRPWGERIVSELESARREACEPRSEEHTSELQSQSNLVCRLLLEKKKNKKRRRLQQRHKKQIERSQ